VFSGDFDGTDSSAVVGEIERLIGMLDDDSTEVAEDAKATLMSIGEGVVGPLAAAVFSLQRYGQLSAVEIFEHLGGAVAGRTLTELLGSGHETVREWSAYALAALDVRDAVPALQAAYRRQRASGSFPLFMIDSWVCAVQGLFHGRAGVLPKPGGGAGQRVGV